jgi:hypothetical protein
MSDAHDDMVVAVRVGPCLATCPHRESLTNLTHAPSAAPGDFHAELVVDGAVWAHHGPVSEEEARRAQREMERSVDRIPGAKRELPQ